MTTAKYPPGLGFSSLRKGKNALESLVEYTIDTKYIILYRMNGFVPVDWVIYSFETGDLLCDEAGDTLVFPGLYEAKGHIIKLYSEHK